MCIDVYNYNIYNIYNICEYLYLFNNYFFYLIIIFNELNIHRYYLSTI